MSRHEGVSCDSCLKGNFRGRRYKCLVCYDYDLCAACYEAGATNTRHTTDHPMQCILTRSDFELYYGGEALTSLELPQSYTCPYCSRMGFTDITLQEHVTSDHQDTNFEVVCPLCAAMPGGDPNLMTDDFAGHLTLEHRTGPRDLISFLDEPVGTRHNVRRIPHNSNHATTHLSRGGTALRPRRSNMHFSVFSSGGLSSLSPSSRESVDPIAELLSQLSGVRRSASNTNSSTPTQLQQLQMQLQLERQQVNAARQQLERFPRRQASNQTLREPSISNCGTSTMMLNASPVMVQPSASLTAQPSYTSQFLLTSTEDLGRNEMLRNQFINEQENPLQLVPNSGDHVAEEEDMHEMNFRELGRNEMLRNVFINNQENPLQWEPNRGNHVDETEEMREMRMFLRRDFEELGRNEMLRSQFINEQDNPLQWEPNSGHHVAEAQRMHEMNFQELRRNEMLRNQFINEQENPLQWEPNSGNHVADAEEMHEMSMFLRRGLLEELAQQSSNDTVRMERSRFVEELVISTAVQVPGSSEYLSQLIPLSTLELEDNPVEPETPHPEEDTSTLAPNAPKAVLRGRARCDPQNAKRRAEANKRNGADDGDR